jgi:type III pantothenate kinase
MAADPHLVLDLGNTRDKWAVFRGDACLAHGGAPAPAGAAGTEAGEGPSPAGRAASGERLDPSSLRHIVQRYGPRRALWSATGAPRPELAEALAEALGPDAVLELTERTPLPFRMAYRTPETLGRDRIAGVAGARGHAPEGPVLVIDAGTCITYDLLDAEDVFHGGVIAPGIRMRLRAMHTMTARLPLVDWTPETPPPPLAGDSTAACLLNGAWRAAAAEADGWIDRYAARWPGLRVLLTGGDGPALAALSEKAIFAAPLLPLEGLNKILIHNVLQGN